MEESFGTETRNKEFSIVEVDDNENDEASKKNDSSRMSPQSSSDGSRSPLNSTDYVVEEPFDYIFEPDHYPSEEIQRRNSQLHENDAFNSKKMCTENTKASGSATSYGNQREREAHMVREIDGVLEYEYKSFSHNSQSMNTNELSFTDYDYQNHHLNAAIRGISLTKCPKVGFGFTLARDKIKEEELIYVSSIEPESPAGFCLMLGDIVIELDDLTPSVAFKSEEEITRYLEEKESIHLIVIHHQKYAQLQNENKEFLKDYQTNCEDIVIVTWKT